MTIWLWLGFLALILVLLALDLGVFHRRNHVFTTREALTWTVIWVAISLLFNVAVYFLYEHHVFGIGQTVGHTMSGHEAALKFFTGYIIEKTLSLDNIFVIAVIFSFFGVKAEYQHRVLFWGILGALVMRGIMIGVGAELVKHFSWMLYVFGALLLVTAVRMLVSGEEEIEPDKTLVVRLARKLFPVSPTFEGPRFFTHINGKRAITPLFLVLLVVETTDVIFAVDSIPAIFGITTDPFLVFTSNVFAILGLRSLYFALAGMMRAFRHMKTALVFVLVFVGVKIIAEQWHHQHGGAGAEGDLISIHLSLGIIAGILFTGAVASMLANRYDTLRELKSGTGDRRTLVELARHQAKRLAILVIGTTIMLFGVLVILVPGPGPAPLIILFGLGVLATEFVWARVMFNRVKSFAEGAADRATNMVKGGKSATDDTPSLVRRWIQKINIPGDGKAPGGDDAVATLPVMAPLIITLDGPAGSGKSTMARRLAQRLGLEFLDTGAMYRGLTAVCLDAGVDPATQPDAVIEVTRKAHLRFDWKADPPRLFVNDHDVTDRLRDPDVTFSVSDVAALGPVRQVLVDAQRHIGEAHPRLVTEGRDQGSVVFPTARVKFYLDAKPEVRAKRRAEELRAADKPADEALILAGIIQRDQRDSRRPDGPLICPPSAIRIDTSDLALDQVLDLLERRSREIVGGLPVPVASSARKGG
ncbi:MAG: (d)CMP kinase [Planctomycetes bacterium]|nr:(d)CMP kinase [Planctomycetota bacterium]